MPELIPDGTSPEEDDDAPVVVPAFARAFADPGLRATYNAIRMGPDGHLWCGTCEAPGSCALCVRLRRLSRAPVNCGERESLEAERAILVARLGLLDRRLAETRRNDVRYRACSGADEVLRQRAK